MDRLLTDKPCNPNSLNPISLAFLGDAVFEVLVREHLALQGDRPTARLHRLAVEFVSAQAQAAAVQRLLPLLSEEELTAYKRGRNAHVSHVPKGASVAQYHSATGFETLFGHLYLTGQMQRMRELFNIICEGESVE